jgi:hypothetical protein
VKDEIRRAIEKELKKSPRIGPPTLPWSLVILVLTFTIVGILIFAVSIR